MKIFNLLLIVLLLVSCDKGKKQVNESSFSQNLDSDNDGISDYDEVQKGESPYIAKVPKIELSIKNNLNLKIKLADSIKETEIALRGESLEYVDKKVLGLIKSVSFKSDDVYDLPKIEDFYVKRIGCFDISNYYSLKGSNVEEEGTLFSDFEYSFYLNFKDSQNIKSYKILSSSLTDIYENSHDLLINYNFIKTNNSSVYRDYKFIDSSLRVENMDFSQIKPNYCYFHKVDNFNYNYLGENIEYSDALGKLEENALFVIRTNKSTNFYSVTGDKYRFENLLTVLGINSLFSNSGNLLKLNGEDVSTESLDKQSLASKELEKLFLFSTSGEVLKNTLLKSGETYILYRYKIKELKNVDDSIHLTEIKNFNGDAKTLYDLKVGDTLHFEISDILGKINTDNQASYYEAGQVNMIRARIEGEYWVNDPAACLVNEFIKKAPYQKLSSFAYSSSEDLPTLNVCNDKDCSISYYSLKPSFFNKQFAYEEIPVTYEMSMNGSVVILADNNTSERFEYIVGQSKSSRGSQYRCTRASVTKTKKSSVNTKYTLKIEKRGMKR